MYLKQPPSLFKAYTSFFIKPSLMWRDGCTTLEELTGLWRTTFLQPTSKFCRGGQSFIVQWSTRTLLSYRQRMHGHLVKPDCWPSNLVRTLKSSQTCQLCSYSLVAITAVANLCMIFWGSLNRQRALNQKTFLLWRRKSFKLRLEASVNSLHSLRS